MIIKLEEKRALIKNDLHSDVLSDTDILEMKEFAALVRLGVKKADFETKQHIFDLLDVRGKLAFETNEKVVYVSCQIKKQQRSLVPTLPSLNIGEMLMTL